MSRSRCAVGITLVVAASIAALAGCASSSATPRGNRWSYMGDDRYLRYGPFEKPGTPDDGRRAERFEAWQRDRVAGIAAARAACARELGESETPGVVFGFSDAFVACMRTRGWWPGGSDPL